MRAINLARRLFALVSLALPFAAFAQDTDAKTTVRTTGSHAFALFLPVAGGETALDARARAPRLDSSIRLEFEKGPTSLVSEWSVLTSPTAVGTPDGETPFLSATPRENAIYVSSDAAKLGVGWQYFAWGSADGINPTDFLNARDYRYGARERKIPLFACAATWYPSDAWSVDGVFAPQYRPDEFGLDWADAIPDELFAGGPRNVVAKEPAPKLSSGTEAVRVRYFGPFFDASASYLYGWDRFYTPDISFLEADGFIAPERIGLERRRLHLVGGDVKATVGIFGVWAEAAYAFTEPSGNDYTRRKPELSWVAGFDFSFGALEEHYFNAQYLGTYIRDFDDSPSGVPEGGMPTEEFYYRPLVQGLGLQTETLSQGIAFTVDLSFLGGKVKPALECVAYAPFGYDDSAGARYGSVVAMPKLVVRPTDGLSVTVGAELAWSLVEGHGNSVKLERESRIGRMTDDNRAYAEIAYAWVLP